jgi:hypothetical protein
MEAFDRLAAICGAFTRHWTSDLNSNISSDISNYEYLCQYMQSCTLLSETGKLSKKKFKQIYQ